MFDSSDNQEAENPAQDVKSAAKTTVKAAAKTGKAAVEAGKIVGAAVSTGGIGGVAMGAKTLATKVGGGLAKKLFSKVAPGLNKFIDNAKNTAKKVAAAAAGVFAYPFVLLAAKIAGIIGAVGGVIGVLGGAANFIISLGGLSIPTAFLAVPFGVGVGTLAVGTLHQNVNITPAAFFTAQGEETTPITPPGTNIFFTITKTASPSSVPNPSVGVTQEVQFTITFTVRDTRLTNVSLEDIITNYNGSVTLQTSSGPLVLPAGTPFSIDCPFNMDPNTTCTQNFTISIDSSYADTVISNTVRVTANPDGQPPQSGNAVASVTVGAPPSSCSMFQYVGNWTSGERTNIDSICALLDQAPNAALLLRNAGVITLIKGAPRSDGVCGTVNSGNIMTIYCDMSGVGLARYVIIHELGHVLGNYNFSLFTLFISSGVYAQESLMPTYPFQVDSPDESFAEMFTEYINSRVYNHLPRSWSGYPGGVWSNPGPGWTTFQQDRPLHYQFAKNQIFGGIEY